MTYDQVTQLSDQAIVTFEIVGSIPTSDTRHLCEELVNALPIIVGFRVLRFRNVGSVVGIVKYP